MTFPAAPATTVAYADCPRCGGWARRMEHGGRWHCRGCTWKGFLRVG